MAGLRSLPGSLSMGSFKGSKRNHGPDRRRDAFRERARELLRFETLEVRRLLDASPWKPTNADIADVKNGPMANAGADLIDVYLAFQQSGGNGASVAASFPGIEFQGNSVRVDVRAIGNFTTFVASLQ